MPSTLPSPPFANLLVVHLDWDLPPSHHARLAPYFLNITSVLKGAPTDAQLMASVPSTPAPRRIINEETLRWMKPSAVLVNVGRGDVVDTDALVHALDEGRLAGAVLDVVNPEPLPDGHTLFGRKNVIVTPHVSGRSLTYPELALDLLVTNLERLLAGEKLVNEVEANSG